MKSPTPEYAKELISYLPSRPDYNTWLYTISAVGNTFTEQIATDILLSHFRDERTNETVYKVNKRLDNINFGTLVFLAKQNGFLGIKSSISNKRSINKYGSSSKHKGKPILKKEKKERIIFDKDPEIITTFRDVLPEFVCDVIELYEKDGYSREEAREITLKDAYWLKNERVYRIAVNKNILNKNYNPRTRKPHQDFQALTSGFKNQNCTLNEIAMIIGRGNSILCSQLKSDDDGKIHRSKDQFILSELFAIDIDNKNNKTKEVLTETEGYLSIEKVLSMPETRRSLMIYTTPNHSEKWNRFRILFPFPRVIKEPGHFSKVVSHYIQIYHADEICSNPVCAFYGFDCTKIFLIPTGDILEFKEGVLI